MAKLVLFFILLIPVNCFAGTNRSIIPDSTTIKKIADRLKTYITDHPVEKAYLHMDKPYYAAGDTIYFKAYVTIGPQHKLSASSEVLNVDLIKPDHSILKSIVLKLTDGITWGDFALDDTLKNGVYRIRAYTNWMRNEGEASFFDKNLPVINSTRGKTGTGKLNDEDAPSKLKHLPPKFDIQFFPEGGNLLNGVLSKVSFKAIAANGLGAMVKGEITDGEGHEVVKFASQHLGMGAFTFKPEAGKKYQAHILYPDSTKAIVQLPAAVSTGYALNINDSDSTNVAINITTGDTSTPAPVFLVAQSGGIIYYTAEGKTGAKVLNAVVDKNRLPTGVVQFTLFSSTGEPLNERLVFIDNKDQLNLKISAPFQNFTPHQKVKISLSPEDSGGQPATGSFSVSVTDETKVPANEDEEGTILSNLLLTSDLKGHIEQPNYYFNNISDTIRADLDVLMLTQGYRQFVWQQILNKQPAPVSFAPEKGFSITGVIKTRWNKPIPYGKVSLLSISKNVFKNDTTADTNGRFTFDHLPTADSMRYIIEATEKKFRGNSIIKIDTLKPAVDDVPHDNEIINQNNLATYAQNSNAFHTEQIRQGIGKHAIELKEVTIRGKKAPPKYLEHSSNLRGPGNADQVITADQLPVGCPVFVDCIRNMLHSVNFYSNKVPGRKAPLIVIDGMALNNDDSVSRFNLDVLNSINMSDVASIEVLSDASTAAAYGVRAGGGVVIITTKRAEDMREVENLAPGILSYSPKGFYKARVFYSARYDTPETNKKFPDLRTTIYWNPNLVTDEYGKTSFEYFNADSKGTYRIVIEGIDDNGTPGRRVYRYKVE